MTAGEQGFLRRHFGKEIDSSYICQSHGVEAKRHRSDPEYVPAWKQKGVKSPDSTACVYPGCAVTCSPFHERVITHSREVLPLFAEALNIEDEISLCESHCHTKYQQSHKRNSCAGCGAKPKVRDGPYTLTLSQSLSIYWPEPDLS